VLKTAGLWPAVFVFGLNLRPQRQKNRHIGISFPVKILQAAPELV